MHRPEQSGRLLRLLKREDPLERPAPPRPLARLAALAPERPPTERTEPTVGGHCRCGHVLDRSADATCRHCARVSDGAADHVGAALGHLAAVARGVADAAADPGALVVLGPDGGWLVDDDDLRAHADACAALVGRVEAGGEADASTLRVLRWCRTWCRILASDVGPHVRLAVEVRR